MQKRAFKIFNKELNNDMYSSKKLLEKCFLNNIKSVHLEKKKLQDFSLYSTHIGFWFKYNFSKFCIHCGMLFL